jgi:hypothetical protein
MNAGSKLTGLLVAGALCLPVMARADTQKAPQSAHKVKKQQPLPPPLPSGQQGPVPQIPLDAIPAVAPQISYQDGLLTIVAPNSTLSEILRGVRKLTAADIEIPASANERVVTRLGPGPAREVMAELLNGSKFNYILLGSPQDPNLLVRVVLVAKSPETPTPAAGAPPLQNAAAPAPDADTTDDTANDDSTDQATQPEQPVPAASDQPVPKTPQELLQEMQQRQLQMQPQPGQPLPYPGRPGTNPQTPPQPPPNQ